MLIKQPEVAITFQPLVKTMIGNREKQVTRLLIVGQGIEFPVPAAAW